MKRAKTFPGLARSLKLNPLADEVQNIDPGSYLPRLVGHVSFLVLPGGYQHSGDHMRLIDAEAIQSEDDLVVEQVSHGDGVATGSRGHTERASGDRVGH